MGKFDGSKMKREKESCNFFCQRINDISLDMNLLYLLYIKLELNFDDFQKNLPLLLTDIEPKNSSDEFEERCVI